MMKLAAMPLWLSINTASAADFPLYMLIQRSYWLFFQKATVVITELEHSTAKSLTTGAY